MNNKKISLFILVIIYFLLKYKIPGGHYIIYPINLLVTFMHEFGHAFFAIITGGSVHSLGVNSNGSGLTITSGGIRSAVIAGGYIGSALFGNILLYIGFNRTNNKKISETTLYMLALLLGVVSIVWFTTIVSSIIIIMISIGVILCAKYTQYDNIILQFLGVSSLLYIIEDFNIGPTSDLSSFSVFLPSSVWMILWLILVLVITFLNLKLIFKK